MGPIELAVMQEREEKRKLDALQAEMTGPAQKRFLVGKAMEFIKQLPGVQPDRKARRKAARELSKRLAQTMRMEKAELDALKAA